MSVDNLSAISVLKSRLEEEQALYAELQEKAKMSNIIITSLQTAMAAITNPSLISQDKTTGNLTIISSQFEYDHKGSWKEKIVSYIKFRSKAVSNAEIVEEFAKHDLSYNKKQITNLVSGAMSFLVANKQVRAYKPTKMKGAYYANPSWFNDDGGLNEENKPDIKENSLW